MLTVATCTGGVSGPSICENSQRFIESFGGPHCLLGVYMRQVRGAHRRDLRGGWQSMRSRRQGLCVSPRPNMIPKNSYPRTSIRGWKPLTRVLTIILGQGTGVEQKISFLVIPPPASPRVISRKRGLAFCLVKRMNSNLPVWEFELRTSLPQVRFWGQAEVDRQPKPAGSVENDPQRSSRRDRNERLLLLKIKRGRVQTLTSLPVPCRSL